MIRKLLLALTAASTRKYLSLSTRVALNIGILMPTNPAFSSFTSIMKVPDINSSKLSPHVLCFCPALALALMLFSGLTGCGPASSDNATNPVTGGSVGGSVGRGMEQGETQLLPPLASERQTGSASMKTLPGGETNTLPLKPDDTLNVESDGRETLPVPGLPDSIAMALDSPDADLRIQALNHWDTQKTEASLDPVFEALEDENEAVRAKATAIIEQAWAEEQERERN